MLVFIWNAADERLARLTEASVLAVCADCRFVRLNARPATALNRKLAGCEEPFFLTLEAGDTVGPDFFRDVGGALASLEDADAGLIVVPQPADAGAADGPPPRAPLFWRTEAVLAEPSPGFAERRLLPFESYALLAKKLQLGRTRTWRTVATSAYRPHPGRPPGWRQAEREWSLLAPLLAAVPSAPPAEAKPIFTIALCTCNDAEYLPWAVRSVATQSLPDWQLIVVDDGSTDGTEQILQSDPLLRDRRIVVIRHAANLGKAACLNRALAAAEGQWLLELDADDWLAPDCLATLARHAAGAGSGIGALYADHIEWLERSNRQLIPGAVRRAAEPVTAAGLLDRPFAVAPRAYAVPLLRELNGWRTDDPSGGRLYEDVQMLARVAQRRTLARVPALLYHRRVRPESVTQRNKARYPAWQAWMVAQLAAER